MKTLTLKPFIMGLLLLGSILAGCSDSTLARPQPKPEVNQQQGFVPENATLYKMQFDKDKQCATFTEVKKIHVAESKAAGLASPLGLCEERLKPSANSRQWEAANAENEDPEEIIYPDVSFVCIRDSKIKKAMKHFDLCEG